jgi:AcrR family transcriptional regulator
LRTGGTIVRALTISDLVRESGVPRTTIHFYLREGLLPQPQKRAGTRSLYRDEHLEFLRYIAKAKAAGRELAQIRTELQPRLNELEGATIDLGEQEYTRIHRAILQVATTEFVKKGYHDTRLSDLMHELGVSSSVFYIHFPTKHQLWIESFCTLLEWSWGYLQPRLAQTDDAIERMLVRSAAGLSLNAINVDMLALINVEALRAHPTLLQPIQDAERAITEDVAAELEAMGADTSHPLPVPGRMLAYVLNTAFHGALTRAARDTSFPLLDFLRTNVWLWLVIRRALGGAIDVAGELAEYDERIREIAEQPPPVLGPTEDLRPLT